jgi:tripartite-type tricarboxylate transporter receptor subunit TctC
VKSIADLVALAKAKPGAINYGSAGTGSSTFLATELFKGQAGINLVHVPYKGGGAPLISVIAGETSVYFSPVATSLPHIQQGRLRTLAMTGAKRWPLLPEIPTIAESGYPGYEFSSWYGLLAPARTPKETIAAVRNAAAAVLKTPGVSRRLIDLSLIPVGDQPEEFALLIKSEVEKVAKLASELHLTADAIK